MNFFAGLEKFGFSGKEDLDITKDERKVARTAGDEKKAVVELEEKDLILEKTIECPVCHRNFVTKQVKTGKAKRLEPDFDLRPNYKGIDTLKYDVTACPYCGYSALNRYFEHLSPTQIKLVREQVGAKYKPVKQPDTETYSYEQAIDRFKLALISSMAKRAKLSEKSYICLKTAWLLRAQLKDFPAETEEQKQKKKEKQQEFVGFYQQAYEGFIKATSQEMPPYCGMDSATVEFMLANVSMSMKRYDIASKLVGNLLTSAGTPARIKDKCHDLKEQILVEMKKQKEAAAQEATQKK